MSFKWWDFGDIVTPYSHLCGVGALINMLWLNQVLIRELSKPKLANNDSYPTLNFSKQAYFKGYLAKTARELLKSLSFYRGFAW